MTGERAPLAPLLPVALVVFTISGVFWFTRERTLGVLKSTADSLRPSPAAPEEGAGPEEEPTAEPGEDELLDLEHPTERDWRFLLETLAQGTPEGRRSAARALVVIGDGRAVRPLLARTGPTEDDAAFFCMAALEILRLQRQEQAVSEMITYLEGGAQRDPGCRIEVADRLALAGGKNPDVLARLVADPEPSVRAFVAGFLSSTGDPAYQDALRELARDSVPEVRSRASLPPAGD